MFGSLENDFLRQITAVIEENISDEHFGVSELAHQMSMSRSNLLRKVKKDTKLSVSQLIRQVRLKHSMDLLRKTSFNVTEVSHQVGFSSTSYFIKCFREYYGYPPGEVGSRPEEESSTIDLTPRKQHQTFIWGVLIFLCVLGISATAYYLSKSATPHFLEKSIAVLPFKNDSNDTTNIYLINGLMESTLNNLQQIKDLRVISRTSTEKYRNTTKSIPEMAKELSVNYFVEGSGQKIENQILLNIQLIDASSDRHLWAKQYRREAKDIFELQQDIAKNIAEEIQAIITPEEEKRIERKPTENLVAYDLFLQGKNEFHKGNRENLIQSIPYYKKAIREDPTFALAHAELTMVYYYLDLFQTEKSYGEDIAYHSDKAFLLDAKLSNSLVAKALFYMHKKEYQQATPYLEKALAYNPNSSLVINFLSELYNTFIPNTSKYLEYALKGAQLDVASSDSIAASYNYLHLSNALVQTGFINESLVYINKSLSYYPDNAFSKWVKAFILYAKNNNIKQTLDLLVEQLNKDTTQIHLVAEIAKVYFLMRDYKHAYAYYAKFIEIRENNQLDLFKNENLRIAMLMDQMGFKDKAAKYLDSFKQFADDDKSIYKHLHLAIYHAYLDDIKKSIDHLKLFSQEDNFQYWVLLLKDDPLVDSIKNTPEFKKIMQDIESRFWKSHQKIRITLEEQGLL